MCPFENMLKIAELLKYKMPIGENTSRFEQVNAKIDINDVIDINVNDTDDIVAYKLKRELREFTRRFEPKEIKNYYENVYFKQRKVNLCKTFRHSNEKSNDKEEVCTCICGSGSKRYLTMPYNSSMREK